MSITINRLFALLFFLGANFDGVTLAQGVGPFRGSCTAGNSNVTEVDLARFQSGILSGGSEPASCSWKLSLPVYTGKLSTVKYVTLRFTRFELPDDETGSGDDEKDACSESYVRISSTDDDASSFERIYCGILAIDGFESNRSLLIEAKLATQSPGFELRFTTFTERDKMMTQFSRSQIPKKGDGNELEQIADSGPDSGCHSPNEMTGKRGVIKSRGYPSLYPHNQKCWWKIKTQPETQIAINFNEKFYLQEGHRTFGCSRDNVTIFVPTDEKTRQRAPSGYKHFKIFCGKKAPGPLLVPSNDVVITFETNHAARKLGFELTWAAVSLADVNREACSQSNGAQLAERSGTIRKPMLDVLADAEAFPDNVTCRWVIDAHKSDETGATSVEFSFSHWYFNESQQQNVVEITFTDARNRSRSYAFSANRNFQMLPNFTVETASPISVVFRTVPAELNHDFTINYNIASGDDNRLGAMVENIESICGILPTSSIQNFDDLEYYSDEKPVEGFTEAPAGAWSWMAHLVNKKANFSCSAAIIHPRWLMTTTSCFTNRRNKADWKVVIGRNHSNHMSVLKPVIRSIFCHKLFEKDNATNDVALISLETPLLFGSSSTAKPICLPTPGVSPSNDNCMALSWFQGKLVLGKASASHCDGHAICAEASSDYPDSSSYPCAPGGALMCRSGDRWELRGLMSPSSCDHDRTSAAVYTNVQSLWDNWIKLIIEPPHRKLG